MKRIITYMVKYNDGSFGIKTDTFEPPVTEENIHLFLTDKEGKETGKIKKLYSHIGGGNHFAKCHFISVTTLEEKGEVVK